MTTLDEWEQKLRSRMGNIQLIGELELGQDQVQEFGQLIAASVLARGSQTTIPHFPGIIR